MWFTYIAVLSALALLRHIWVRYLKPLRSFNGKHVLITGGSMGIGLDMAKSLAKMGAKVTIWARKLNQLEIAAREIGGNVNFESVDVSDFQSVSKGMDNAIKVHGDVDYLICNAGATAPGYIEELDVGVFDWLMKINYMGSVNTVKAALPHMIQRKSGNIVFIGSAMSLIGFVGYSAYAPTKWALRGFADSIRNELLKYNINVSIAYPPDTKTPGYAEELKMRPKELNMISPESDSFTSQIVADKLIESLRQGSYHLDTPDILQALLVSLRSGVSPRTNIFLDVLLAPLQQIIAVGYCMFMDYVAKSSAAKSSQNSKKTN